MGLYTRPDSPWWWYLLEGTNTRRSTGIPHVAASPEQAREMKRQALAIYIDAKAKHARADPTVPTKPIISFTAYAEWFDTHHSAHLRSVDRERSMLKRLGEYFGTCRSLTEIDDTLVREWMTSRSKQVSKSTVNRELDVLKSLVRSAVPKYLDATPLGNIRRFRLAETEPRVLSVDEEARLLAVCGAEDRALILTALDTLLRLSSVVRLEWPQVKLDRQVIVPLNAKVSTKPKPISTRLHAALSALAHSDRYVFASLHAGLGETAAKNRAIRRFDALCRNAGLDRGRAIEGLTFHCLRHTGATRALQRGASLRTVMELGGWRNADTVLRYLHVADVDVIAAAESIGAPQSRSPESRNQRVNHGRRNAAISSHIRIVGRKAASDGQTLKTPDVLRKTRKRG